MGRLIIKFIQFCDKSQFTFRMTRWMGIPLSLMFSKDRDDDMHWYVRFWGQLQSPTKTKSMRTIALFIIWCVIALVFSFGIAEAEYPYKVHSSIALGVATLVLYLSYIKDRDWRKR